MQFSAVALAAVVLLLLGNNHLGGVVEAQKTLDEIAMHATSTDCWTAVGENVYDLSGYTGSHNARILVMCGTDGTQAFDCKHSRSRLTQPSEVVNLGLLVDANGNPAPSPSGCTSQADSSSDDGGGDSSSDDGGGFFGICFSGTTRVQLEDGSQKMMRDLRVGDRVQVDVAAAAAGSSTSQPQYEAVYAFAKRDATVRAEYRKLEWKSMTTARGNLEISDKHMISVAKDVGSSNNEWKMIPASKVEVGDKVQVDGESIAEVTSIGKVKRTGAYAPLTFSGRIVVDHVQASSYVSYQNEEYLMLGSGTPVFVTYQWLAQTLFMPIRWMGAAMAPWKMDSFSWLPRFFLAFEKVVLAVLELPAPVLLPFVIPFVGVLGVASLFESILLAGMDHTLPVVTLFLAGAVLHKHWKESGMHTTVRALKKKVG